jgi:hypothetical protein
MKTVWPWSLRKVGLTPPVTEVEPWRKRILIGNISSMGKVCQARLPARSSFCVTPIVSQCRTCSKERMLRTLPGGGTKSCSHERATPFSFLSELSSTASA